MSRYWQTIWPVIVLGALSLSVGFAWGRFRQPASDVLVDDASELVPEEREIQPATVDSTADTTSEGTEVPGSSAKASPPDANLAEVAALVESLANATPEEIAQLPWDRRARAALDKLRGSGSESYPVDSGLPPSVLGDLLSNLLDRASSPLTEAQSAELEQLTAEWEEQIERQLADLGDDSLALERELSVISATDDFLEEMAALLDEQQSTRLESWTPETLEWPPFLSPLTGAPIARREIRSDELPGIRDDLSRSLARDLGLDPEDGDYYAAKLVAEVERLLEPPRHRDDIIEWIVALGDAQAQIYRELLTHPAVDAAARRRLLARRHWLVPTVAGE